MYSVPLLEWWELFGPFGLVLQLSFLAYCTASSLYASTSQITKEDFLVSRGATV